MSSTEDIEKNMNKIKCSKMLWSKQCYDMKNTKFTKLFLGGDSGGYIYIYIYICINVKFDQLSMDFVCLFCVQMVQV